MFLFKKNKDIKQKCKHKFKDFDWYIRIMKYSHSSSDERYTAEVVEPYVCILCGYREDRVLTHGGECFTEDGAKRDGDKFEQIYKNRIKHRAFVEDKINDFQLVDRAFLEAWEQANGDVLHTIKKDTQKEQSSLGTPITLIH